MKKYIKIIFAIGFFSFCTIILNAQNCTQCNNTTTGTDASAIGKNTNASGTYSFASGLEVQSNGDLSFAHGKFLSAEGTYSMIFGSYANAEVPYSMVIGYGKNNDTRLINSISNSLMIGFNSNQPTFFVKGGIPPFNTGQIGIGNVTDPQAKLHIKADEGEEAVF